MGKHEKHDEHPWHRRIGFIMIRIMHTSRDVLIGGGAIILFDPLHNLLTGPTTNDHVVALVQHVWF